MAECARRKVGGSRGTLFPAFWVPIVWAIWLIALGLMSSAVEASMTATNESMVVNKTLLLGACKDSNNAVVGDGAEWSTGCNKVVCQVESSGNYTITHGCRSLVLSENPDTTNCITVANPASPYPHCCPYLQCGTAALPSTINPALCYDISAYRTCHIWKELTSNCTDTKAFVYNFTLVYCRLTCGFCPGGSG